MSQLYVNNIKNRVGGAVSFTQGFDAAGVSTIRSNLTVTGNVSGVDGTFSGNVSVGGTLTYEDVENIDSVGLVTARSGVIASGIGISVSEGGVRVTGVVTATSFVGDGSGLTGVESWNQFDTWLYGGG